MAARRRVAQPKEEPPINEKPATAATATAASGRPLGFAAEKGGLSSSWIVADAPAPRSRSPSKHKAPRGPLDWLGGGLGVLTAGELRILALLLLVAGVVRTWKIARPASVVFDEVHFGGFATKYIQSKFFMDVHPPLAKLLITLSAWLAGFKGDFDFKEIGKEYAPDNVPYIPMRMLPATLGIALIPLAYLTIRGLSCRPTSALLAALFLTFDNGLITQSRHILLDSPLIFFTGLTTFCWVGFCNEDHHQSFTKRWWTWLFSTGLSLGAVLSCKWVGLFTVATIGLSTVAQLWMLLGDTRIPIPLLFRHFVARAIGLILLPVIFYMAMFEIHFLVLSHSGEGDGFMSAEFQHTLIGHGMEDTYADVAFGSRITIRHLNTQGGYLHSHPHSYPAGSKQQQVTLYPHKDENNEWIIFNHTTAEDGISPEKDGPLVMVDDKLVIRMQHPSTNKKLHSHDLRPPVSDVDWQQEVSCYGFEGFDGDANDNFVVEIVPDKTDKRDSKASKRLRALRSRFRLRHQLTGCYLFSHKVKLPDWGFEQQEVTCNKNPSMANSLWFIETATHPLNTVEARAEKVNYLRPGFFAKFAELQKVMWTTNAGLTDRHAYDSRPGSWPLLRRGINFWVKEHRQIYLIGNPVVWYLSTLAVLAYLGMRVLLVLRDKRGYKDFHNTTVVFYDRLCGFLCLGWALHYFPFFIMQRQLFLHHYFPALYFAVLLHCAIFDLATNALKPKIRLQVALVLVLAAVWAFWHWSPLAYASQWTRSQCESAKLMKTWDFGCGEFPVHYSDYASLDAATKLAQSNETSAAINPVEAGPNPFGLPVEKPKSSFGIEQPPHDYELEEHGLVFEPPGDLSSPEDTPAAGSETPGRRDEQAPLPLAPAGATEGLDAPAPEPASEPAAVKAPILEPARVADLGETAAQERAAPPAEAAAKPSTEGVDPKIAATADTEVPAKPAPREVPIVRGEVPSEDDLLGAGRI